MSMKEKDYSSYYEIDEDGVTTFLKSWEEGDDFEDLEKELPLMLEQNRLDVLRWEVKKIKLNNNKQRGK